MMALPSKSWTPMLGAGPWSGGGPRGPSGPAVDRELGMMGMDNPPLSHGYSHLKWWWTMVNMKHREKMVMKHRQSETSSINMVILGIDDGGFLNAAFESFGNGFISCRDQADVSWIGCRARVMDCCETTGRLDLLKSPVANQNNNIFQVIHHLGNRLDAFYWGHLELFGAFWVRCEKTIKKPLS